VVPFFGDRFTLLEATLIKKPADWQNSDTPEFPIMAEGAMDCRLDDRWRAIFTTSRTPGYRA
jgi:hypothetical protein